MKLRLLIAVLLCLTPAAALADPCGMVPPVYPGETVPLARTGLQQTYVFYRDGVETFVIRPGFTGKVDEFGMLIPFPSPPALRKVPDTVFTQVAAAVDPPEVVVDLRQRFWMFGAAAMGGASGVRGLKYDVAKSGKKKVRVIREEAVGMYEVAVLEAGSPAALKKWMETHGYRYPTGMDKVCEEYIEINWCFVAIKAKVGSKPAVQPAPGQRQVNSKLPAGSTFDGYVQGMGFRFKTDELVVPMRLSAFNEGDLRNVVYLLTDEPKKIRLIPEEYVVRQIDGPTLRKNVTQPLPLRIIGGVEADIPESTRKSLKTRRDPTPKNGVARELFAADLQAVATGKLSLPQEESEKVLLNIGEKLGLRGAAIDAENAAALDVLRKKTLEEATAKLDEVTLTVIDGDFPREVLAKHNLTFASYKMPAARNNNASYDAVIHGPAAKKQGVLKTGALAPRPRLQTPNEQNATAIASSGALWTIGSLLLAGGVAFWFVRRRG